MKMQFVNRKIVLASAVLASSVFCAPLASADLTPIFTSQTVTDPTNQGYDIQAPNVTLTVGSIPLGATDFVVNKANIPVSVDNNNQGAFGYINANVNLAGNTEVPGVLGFNHPLNVISVNSSGASNQTIIFDFAATANTILLNDNGSGIPSLGTTLQLQDNVTGNILVNTGHMDTLVFNNSSI